MAMFDSLKHYIRAKLLSALEVPGYRLVTTDGSPNILFNALTIEKAVKDGYQSDVYVYRCVKIIADAIKSVRFIVVNNDTQEPQLKHPVQAVLDMPNKELSGQTIKTILTQHLQLAGNAFFQKVMVGNKVVELWPIQPDKLETHTSDVPGQLVKIYRMNDGSRTYQPDEIIHFKMPNPSNPLKGISPLMAASKKVDISNEQNLWNYSSFKNRAIPDGIITYEMDYTPDQLREYARVFNEGKGGSKNSYKNWFMGGKAKYQRMSNTPIEMDFIESIKLVREEICIAFGVPPIMVGTMDSATYNNLATADRVLWEQTILPQLSDICDALTQGFEKMLGPNLVIKPDVSNIKALEDSLNKRINDGKVLFSMGVPLTEVNNRLKLGLNLDGVDTADQSFVQGGNSFGQQQQFNAPGPAETRDQTMQADHRDQLWRSVEKKRLSWEDKVKARIAKAFNVERQAILANLSLDMNPKAILKASQSEWEAVLSRVYGDVINDFISKKVKKSMHKRAKNEIDKAVSRYIKANAAKKIGYIEDTTAEKIANAVQNVVDSEGSVEDLRQNINDLYDGFEDSRSLAIARTEIGGASSFGQMESGRIAGAAQKVWVTSRDGAVRDSHAEMDGEAVDIDELFSNDCEFPCDPSGPPDETVNCRCAITFELDDGQEIDFDFED